MEEKAGVATVTWLEITSTVLHSGRDLWTSIAKASLKALWTVIAKSLESDCNSLTVLGSLRLAALLTVYFYGENEHNADVDCV